MENEEEIKEAPVQKKRKSNFRWLGRYNRLIVKNVPFYFFLGALAIVYIANGHQADKMLRKTSKTEKAIKEMEYEFKTAKRDVIFRSKESELARAVEPLGLKQLTEPAAYIKDTLKRK